MNKKVIMVTGASSGMGKDFALLMFPRFSRRKEARIVDY
jgi:NADP-dependent 3-hydroxy acid dehydrogenase YdfG